MDELDTSSDEDSFFQNFGNQNWDKFNAHGARFLLALKASCGVNGSATLIVMEETKKLLYLVFDQTIAALSKHGYDAGKALDVNKLRREVCNIFEGVHTVRRQKSVFYRGLGVVKPRSVPIKISMKKTGVGKLRKTIVTEENFYYIPIQEVLRKILECPDYEKLTKREVSADPEILDCYLKGDLAKENSVLKCHPDALRLILYYDETETCTSLSPRASANQKLGVFYLTLDNFDPKHRGVLNSINLVALVTYKFLKGEGLKIVLSRILRDLKELENGVILNGKEIFATVISTIGDNLGVHFICGFKCGFTAHRLCRVCMATNKEVRELTVEDPSNLRTIALYEKQIHEIDNAKTLKARDAKSLEYGLTGRCPFNELKSFHVIGGVPPDLMHDILEGCLLRALKNIINHCVKDLKLVTLSWLNCAIADFDFGYSESSGKPSDIKADHLEDDGKLHQSAYQVWTLGFTLPLILGPEVPEGDEKWCHFIKLLEIMKIAFSREIHKSSLPLLSHLIQEYLSGYKTFYGPLKPKEHFLIHYPTWIVRVGTLLDFMCMRFEAQHQFFKRLVYILGNYKNIPKSLTEKFQIHQAYKFMGPLVPSPQYGKMTRLQVQECSYGHLLRGTAEIIEASWVKASGFFIQANEKCYICYGLNEEGRPAFACVACVIVWPEIVFVCKETLTEYYHSHYCAYKVVDSSGFVFKKLSDIVGKRVYHCHVIGHSKYISMKECVMGSL